MAFFIYQLIILWTISINWHRWLLVNNHISKYNSFILVLYRRYINYVSVCPPPPPHFLAHSYATNTYILTFNLLLIVILFFNYFIITTKRFENNKSYEYIGQLYKWRLTFSIWLKAEMKWNLHEIETEINSSMFL